MTMQKTDAPSPGPFETQYPGIADWIDRGGVIEIGPDGHTDSFIRALDEGGTVWDSSEEYPTLDDALKALNEGIKTWVDENL